MANKINPFDPNVNSGLYNVHFPDFAFWLQKTQPLVYDDALSYYEVLCRISAMLNQLIKQVNDLTDAQKKFIEDATKLLNQIISEWNSMVDTWNGWEAADAAELRACDGGYWRLNATDSQHRFR